MENFITIIYVISGAISIYVLISWVNTVANVKKLADGLTNTVEKHNALALKAEFESNKPEALKQYLNALWLELDGYNQLNETGRKNREQYLKDQYLNKIVRNDGNWPNFDSLN